MKDHIIEKDYMASLSSPHGITVHNWGRVDYCLWFDTDAKRDEAYDKMVRGEDEYYNERKHIVQTRWGTFRV